MRTSPALPHLARAVACSGGVLALWLVAACASDEPPAPVLDYELFETTDLLDAESLDAIESASDDLSTIRFARTTPALERVAARRVLLGGASTRTPRGLCRLVTSVERSGDALVVHSTPATVFHAFRRMNLELTDNVGGPVLAELPVPPPRGPGAARSPLTQSIPLGDPSISWPVSEGDGNPLTTEDRIEANGGLTATLSFTFKLKFDWMSLSPEEAFSALDDLLGSLDDLFDPTATLAELLHLHFELSVTADADAHLNVAGKASLAFDPERTLSVVPLGVYPIGPLVFTPAVELVAKVEGGATGDLDLDWGVATHFGAGLVYDAGEPPDTWKTGPTFVTTPPSATASASARARATLTLRLHMPLYGFAGPYAAVAAWGELDAQYGRTPCWSLDAGVDAEVGASLGVFGHSLATTGVPIPITSTNLASGACAPPPDPPPTTAVITPWSRTYQDTTWSGGDPEGWTEIELATNGNLLLGSSSSRYVVEVTQSGAPVWTRLLHDTDPTAAVPDLRVEHATPTRDTGVLVGTRDDVYAKLTGDGALLWAAELDSGNDWAGWSAQALVDHDTWVGGKFARPGAPLDTQDAWLAALGPDGTVRWAFTWGVAELREEVRRIVPLADGALVVGNGARYVGGPSVGFALRVRADGTVAWAKRLEDCAGADDVRLDTALETGEGNFVLAGLARGSRPAALLLRLAPDGSDGAPAWSNATGVAGLLGLRLTSLAQLSTGEYRVAGTHWTASDDAVFVAGTDAVGRFAWAREYGGPGDDATAGTFVTQDGGLLVAATAGTLAGPTGGLWLTKVPLSDGAISFDPGGGATSAPLAFEASAPFCVQSPPAPTATTALPIALWSRALEARPVTLDVRAR